MKYSVFTLITPEFELEETVKKLHSIGYDGIEWRVHIIPKDVSHQKPSYWGYNKSTVDLDTIEEKADYVRKISEEQNLEICTLSTYLGVNELEKIEKVMKASNVMKCPQIRVNVPWFKAQNYNKLYTETIENLHRVEKLAQKYNVKAILETHMGNIMPSAGLAYRIVSNFAPEYIGVIYDPGNMICEGIENWYLGVELLGKYLAHVHVKNLAWYKKDNKWQIEVTKLDEGIVDWKQVIDALKSVNYRGYLSIEDTSDVSTEQKLIYNLKYLKELE